MGKRKKVEGLREGGKERCRGAVDERGTRGELVKVLRAWLDEEKRGGGGGK